MGNREALMAAAKACLLEKGYARTTARDVAGRAGVSLAAIGYHYGATEVLLRDALLEANTEWAEQLGAIFDRSKRGADGSVERFEAVATEMLQALDGAQRLWSATFEAAADLDETPELREGLLSKLDLAREGLSEMYLGAPDDDAGRVYHALLLGLAAQILLGGDAVPTAKQLAAGFKSIVAAA